MARYQRPRRLRLQHPHQLPHAQIPRAARGRPQGTTRPVRPALQGGVLADPRRQGIHPLHQQVSRRLLPHRPPVRGVVRAGALPHHHLPHRGRADPQILPHGAREKHRAGLLRAGRDLGQADPAHPAHARLPGHPQADPGKHVPASQVLPGEERPQDPALRGHAAPVHGHQPDLGIPARPQVEPQRGIPPGAGARLRLPGGPVLPRRVRDHPAKGQAGHLRRLHRTPGQPGAASQEGGRTARGGLCGLQGPQQPRPAAQVFLGPVPDPKPIRVRLGDRRIPLVRRVGPRHHDRPARPDLLCRAKGVRRGGPGRLCGAGAKRPAAQLPGPVLKPPGLQLGGRLPLVLLGGPAVPQGKGIEKVRPGQGPPGPALHRGRCTWTTASPCAGWTRTACSTRATNTPSSPGWTPRRTAGRSPRATARPWRSTRCGTTRCGSSWSWPRTTTWPSGPGRPRTPWPPTSRTGSGIRTTTACTTWSTITARTAPSGPIRYSPPPCRTPCSTQGRCGPSSAWSRPTC